ncbi:MAG: hypothetical protein ACOVP2_11660, partial [Armatimonadaceae bacterium]
MDVKRFRTTIGLLGIVTLSALSVSATGKEKHAGIAKPALQLTGAVSNITLDGPWTSHRIV